MSIIKDNPEENEIIKSEPEGEEEGMGLYVTLDTGLQCRIAYMFDKDDNETESFDRASTLLCQSDVGDWYEIHVQEGTWTRTYFH